MRRGALSLMAVVLAGCGGMVVSETFTDVGEVLPTDSPATASQGSDAAPTITMVSGAAVGGPGGSIADALGSGQDQPLLVNGVLVLDGDGAIWLCDSIDDTASPPECGEPRLRVLEYPDSPQTWDLANAEVTGLQEKDGVLWFEGNQLYGQVTP